MEIDWGKINNGYKGFEKLALDYVKDNFSNPTWKKTNETRDGNKDAIAYIFGYKSAGDEATQWWMEAKYSAQKKHITRYRLDATIVSALLEGNIDKVIFVTNTLIYSKTITDIRRVLIKSTNCNSVEFCTKPMIEYWLLQNIQILKKYFNIDNKSLLKLSNYDYSFLSQELSFYEYSSNRIVFVEAAHELFIGKTYTCHFSFYSSQTKEIEIKKPRACVGIKILGNRKLKLRKGENNLEFQIFINKKAINNKSVYFVLDNIEIVPSYPVSIINNYEHIIDIPSQLIIKDSVENKLQLFLSKQNTKFIIISGLYGSGRTQIIKELGHSRTLISEYYYQLSFTDSSVRNSKLVVYFILFLLFPYLNPDDIDELYLKSISSNIVTNSIIELVKSKSKYDNLIELFKEYIDYYDFLPRNIKINKRIVFIDDLDYLDNYCMAFLLKILKEIQRKNLPIFIVITVNNNFLKTNTFEELSKYCFFDVYNYFLNLKDINYMFNSNITTNFLPINDLENQFSIIELFAFFRYIRGDNDCLNDINGVDSFITKYKVFQSSSILQNHIIKEFNNLFNELPNCKTICDAIYSSHIPINANKFSENKNEILQLLENGLIKYDYYNCLLPINHIYQKNYINHYQINYNSIIKYNDINNSESLRIKFENEINPEILHQLVLKIIEKYKEKNYSFILYALDDVFKQPEKLKTLEKRINNQKLFIELYFAYAYAVHLQSTDDSSREHLKNIISITKNSSNKNIKKICIKAIWEMIISEYEFLNYSSSLAYIKELSIMLIDSFVSKNETLLNYVKYHDAMTVKSQIETDIYGLKSVATCDYRTSLSKKYNFEKRYYNTRLRLAIIRSVFDIETAIETINECTDYFLKSDGNENKMFIIGKFSFLFYMTVYNKGCLINEVIEYHQKMRKNQYHNYRKRCYAIASYFYMIGDVETGNKYLYPEIYLSRDLADRNYAYYQCTIALNELINNNYDNSLDALNKAYKCFSSLPSYNVIIKHNIDFVLNKKTVTNNVVFWDGNSMNPEKFYIDPRIII